MNIKLPFGFTIRNDKAEDPSFVTPSENDGALEQVQSGAGFFGYSFDSQQIPKNEIELINRYRAMQQIPEVEAAIDEIISEAITIDDDDDLVKIDLVNAEEQIPKKVRNMIDDEFKNILSLLNFNTDAYNIFRQWYVDGRDFRHIVVDEHNLAEGIKDIRYIDPRKIKKVREITKNKNPGGIDIVTGIEEYFLYTDSGTTTADTGVKLSVDTIAYTPSGLVDEKGVVISHLQSAIKPANMLKYLEDATVIAKITRAPERRVFYIDVADMPKTKAEQYLKDVMNKYRNKITYDPTTGDVKSDTQNFSMMEDFWLPRRSNGRSTEITTLPGMDVGNMDDVTYFLNKLLSSLKVPASRLGGDQNFSIGRSEQITRDEVKFTKFITRLRHQFSKMFNQLLRVQLVLKGIITPEDWQFIESKIRYQFAKDNYFAELKDNEVLAQRLQMLAQIEPYVGAYFSPDYVKTHILRLSSEEQDATEDELEMLQAQTKGK